MFIVELISFVLIMTTVIFHKKIFKNFFREILYALCLSFIGATDYAIIFIVSIIVNNITQFGVDVYYAVKDRQATITTEEQNKEVSE